jgi:hypothetical protein
MGLLVHFPQAGGIQMGVNLGGGQVRVAQQQLQDPQVGPPGQKMGGKGMAQGVGTQTSHSGLQGIVF